MFKCIIILCLYTHAVAIRENDYLCSKKDCSFEFNGSKCFIQNVSNCLINLNDTSNLKLKFAILPYIWVTQRSHKYIRYLGLNLTWDLRNNYFNNNVIYIKLYNLLGDELYGEMPQCKSFNFEKYMMNEMFYDCFYMLPTYPNILIYWAEVSIQDFKKSYYIVTPNVENIEPLIKPFNWKTSISYDPYSNYIKFPLEKNITYDNLDNLIDTNLQSPSLQLTKLYPNVFKYLTVILWLAKIKKSSNYDFVGNDQIKFSFNIIDYIFPLRIDNLTMVDSLNNIEYGLTHFFNLRVHKFLINDVVTSPQHAPHIPSYLKDNDDKSLNFKQINELMRNILKNDFYLFLSARPLTDKYFTFSSNPTWLRWFESQELSINETAGIDFQSVMTPLFNLSKVLLKHPLLREKNVTRLNLILNHFNLCDTPQYSNESPRICTSSPNSEFILESVVLEKFLKANLVEKAKKRTMPKARTDWMQYLKSFSFIKSCYVIAILFVLLLLTTILVRFISLQYHFHYKYRSGICNLRRNLYKNVSKNVPVILILYSRKDGWMFCKFIEIFGRLIQTLYTVKVVLDVWSLQKNPQNPILWLEKEMIEADLIILTFNIQFNWKRPKQDSSNIQLVKEKPWIDLMLPALQIYLNDDERTKRKLFIDKTMIVNFCFRNNNSYNNRYDWKRNFFQSAFLFMKNTIFPFLLLFPAKILPSKYLVVEAKENKEVKVVQLQLDKSQFIKSIYNNVPQIFIDLRSPSRVPPKNADGIPNNNNNNVLKQKIPQHLKEFCKLLGQLFRLRKGENSESRIFKTIESYEQYLQIYSKFKSSSCSTHPELLDENETTLRAYLTKPLLNLNLLNDEFNFANEFEENYENVPSFKALKGISDMKEEQENDNVQNEVVEELLEKEMNDIDVPNFNTMKGPY